MINLPSIAITFCFLRGPVIASTSRWRAGEPFHAEACGNGQNRTARCDYRPSESGTLVRSGSAPAERRAAVRRYAGSLGPRGRPGRAGRAPGGDLGHPRGRPCHGLDPGLHPGAVRRPGAGKVARPHRARHEPARLDLPDQPRGLPRGAEDGGRPSHLRAGADGVDLCGAAPRRVHRGCVGRGDARGAHGADLSPGRSRPGECQELPEGRAGGDPTDKRCDPWADCCQLLQHRHRRLHGG